MEVKVNDVQLPEITFNFEELKQEIVEKVKQYELTVYNDEQIKKAKADRAMLNNLKKALNSERIRREKEYMKPFDDFKCKINELIEIIENPILLIDDQIKCYEKKQKTEKCDKLLRFFESQNHLEWLKFEQIFNKKWLNASARTAAIEAEIKEKIEQIEKELFTLSKLPKFSFEAIEEYKTTLDINKAVNEAHKLTELETKKNKSEKNQKEIVEKLECSNALVDKEWISFSAYLTVDEALALKDFFRNRNIDFKPI